MEKTTTKIISSVLDDNLSQIKEAFGNANDLLIRELILTKASHVKLAFIGIDGLIDASMAQQFALHVLSYDLPAIDEKLPKRADQIFDLLLESRISMIDANSTNEIDIMHNNILNGHLIVLVDGVAKCMMFDCKGWQSRGISEPNTEKSLRGPKDSFVETIRFNTAMLRRRLRDPRLRFDAHQVGTRSKTDVFVTYIDGLTNPEFINLTNQRIKNIDIDSITNTYELIQLIEDKHRSFFPRLVESERPDRVMKGLTEGQVAIFVDGSPFAILGPFNLTSAFSAIDDYYTPPLVATFKRLLRYIAFFTVILVPGFFIALSTFHQEMIPTSLLVTIINQRSSNPFSALVEISIVIILFEVLREASLRKPDAIGDSMTLAGSLIIGQTIVESGIVSYAAVIVGALSAIFSFLISSTRVNLSARILKFVFMFVGAKFGFYGLTLSFIVLITHMASITTMGQAYLAPIAPFNLSDQKDQLFKFPITWMKKRPKVFETLDQVKMSNRKGGS